MLTHPLTPQDIAAYLQSLQRDERSTGTIKKYAHDIDDFYQWLSTKPVSKDVLNAWKKHLLDKNYAPVTINAKLAALNGLCRFLGWNDCHVRFLKIQRRLFRDSNRELTRYDYARLVSTARRKRQERLALLMETICASGIRVSEVAAITVEAAAVGRADVSLKGKIRTIFLSPKLCRKLLKYARKKKILSGPIFITRKGHALSRHQIWAEMKALAKIAGVKASKVFPHNLRHLFATVYYAACKDIVRLADILGHTSIDTTRIYLTTSGSDYAQQLERLKLIL